MAIHTAAFGLVGVDADMDFRGTMEFHTMSSGMMSQTPLRLAFSVARPLRRQQDPRLYFRACRPITDSSSTQRRPRYQTPLIEPRAVSQSPRRSFSSSNTVRATVVVHNRRVDDDGKDMTIEISERASKAGIPQAGTRWQPLTRIQRLKQITSAAPQKNTLASSSSSSPGDSHLRVTVTAGGCHGFQYLMSLEDGSKLDPEEDTIFASEEDGDSGKARVVMDQASLELLKGSTIDFTTELIGSQFKIVGNPRATSSCGCGTSFDIE
ncbi:[4Fe-4S] proteins maturation [Exophiala xenobiotica]|nr:[4Fe-4S] proteins maturation [Exophiala xenobiotica]KAK5307369.1 [4Fe-4S] proteins maturation [Exophiala xenobiotica]KAK5355471.1 [4Fe-4S] proteins maturation [Exophiala xenobiotica]KAK5386437.1 [4Fe-4S] proteins maturation [Exophiala xenobiotica]KAK5399567.1 [4Fe-4S] proteins maturation [Exophiala xenobiotica]